MQPTTHPSAGEVRPGVQRGLIAATQVLGLAVWFSVSAVVPSMQQDLGVSDAATVWLTG
jgi:nitrate/nitrite transporter NarK